MTNNDVIESNETLKAEVRETYGRIAREGGSCCAPGCCDTTKPSSSLLGYSSEDTESTPAGADMGLGCGNPLLIASLKEGEVVVDLGSGAGFDSFLAAKQVGGRGRVVGVDMTADMVSKARKHAREHGYENVEFRLGEIEQLPVPDASVDAIISNCVINLSVNKKQVFREAFRVLKPGGRLAISDIVASKPLPEKIRSDLALFSGCVAGASPVSELESAISEAGFHAITIEEKPGSKQFIKDWAPEKGVEDYVSSATITARKP